jgi:hypothetical protein
MRHVVEALSELKQFPGLVKLVPTQVWLSKHVRTVREQRTERGERGEGRVEGEEGREKGEGREDRGEGERREERGGRNEEGVRRK